MQIDFHHTATYTVARCAGFSHAEADIIAYSSQYVDDATNSGTITFDNKAMYHRISSAHKMLDYNNFKALANHQVWIPFHFLPGNDGLKEDENVEKDGKSFIHKIVCTPNSPIAKNMIKACLDDKNKPYALHRLGITMHVYADTWAHQGFAGVNHKINEVTDLNLVNEVETEESIWKKLIKFKNRMFQKFISREFPLGHGPALSCPDKPYLKWSYTNGLGESVPKEGVRDNCEVFMEAIEQMFLFLTYYRSKPQEPTKVYLKERDREQFRKNFQNFKFADGEMRHEHWLQSLSEGDFSFGPTLLTYIPKGVYSWKHQALGTTKWIDGKKDTFRYASTFLNSDWKLFHDALQAHRFEILHDILPRYGICAA